MLVAVQSGAQSVLRIVQVDNFDVLKSDYLIKRCHSLLDSLLHVEVIACSVGVAGVEADSNSFPPLHAIENLLNLFKLGSHAVLCPSHILQADLEISLCSLDCQVQSIRDSLETDLSSSPQVTTQMRNEIGNL